MQRWTEYFSSVLADRNRRIIAIVATIAVFGGIITVNQVSSAATRRERAAARACATAAPAAAAAQPSPEVTATAFPRNGRGSYVDRNGVTQHLGDGQVRPSRANRTNRGDRANPTCTPSTGTDGNGGTDEGTDGDEGTDEGTDGNNNGGNDGDNDGDNDGNNNGGNDGGAVDNEGDGVVGDDTNGLAILGDDCGGSQLQPHTGFQEGPRCVDTEFGEVGAAGNNPSLLITEIPGQVQANEPFTISVSTRNLVRDRFLGAAAGGYYLESSFLTDDGLVRGHFHTACRVLQSTNEAPDPEPVPAFFVATEDGAGGDQPDTIDIQVPGIADEGTVQCAVWAGDGSHRLPMMERANQTPAFDVARVEVN